MPALLLADYASALKPLTVSVAGDFSVEVKAVGKKMTEAFMVLNLTVSRHSVRTFNSAAEAVQGIRSMVLKDDLVFLKGSRSTGLEIIEPEAE